MKEIVEEAAFRAAWEDVFRSEPKLASHIGERLIDSLARITDVPGESALGIDRLSVNSLIFRTYFTSKDKTFAVLIRLDEADQQFVMKTLVKIALGGKIPRVAHE